MKRAERRLWQSAHTITDVGDLTARWLERDIGQHPGYRGRSGPDPETATVAADLAAINRAGFVTHSSQPGRADGPYRQRAAVEGFTSQEVAERLKAASGGQIMVIVQPPLPPRKTNYSRIVPVSMLGDRATTHFGTHMSTADIVPTYDILPRDAVEELAAATQVTVIGLEWGGNGLWAWIRDVLL